MELLGAGLGGGGNLPYRKVCREWDWLVGQLGRRGPHSHCHDASGSSCGRRIREKSGTFSNESERWWNSGATGGYSGLESWYLELQALDPNG